MAGNTPLVHLSNDRGHDPPVVACNMQTPVKAKLTEERSKVTCGQCKKDIPVPAQDVDGGVTAPTAPTDAMHRHSEDRPTPSGGAPIPHLPSNSRRVRSRK